MYKISECEWMTDDGQWVITVESGRPHVYFEDEFVDMQKVNVPNEVEEMYISLGGFEK